MEAVLKKWGNSQGILLPKSVCEYLGITVGDHLKVEESHGSITMRPVNNQFSRSKRITATELFADWDNGYQPPSDWSLNGAEMDWGASVGKEMPW